MTSIGIIAEYNPFHNGHLYQIQKIKEKYKDAIIVVVMNGYFTERGDCSIVSKWDRANMALDAGCDLIIELPFPFATQSADYFSYGAITILEKLKVKKVIFGSESNDLSTLEEIVDIELNHKEFNQLVKVYSKLGKNYPTALSCAIFDLVGKEVKSPNDLLGISYLKTIKKYNYKIEAEIIQRTNSYHDLSINKSIASGSAIREAIKRGEEVKEQVPDFVLPYLKNFHFIEEYFPFLQYRLLSEEELTKYQGVDIELASMIKKEILKVNSYQELVERLKHKNYTRNRICRMLLHILCGFTKELAKEYKEITYLHILGFSKEGREYLNKVKKEIDVPLISKISKKKDSMLEYELQTSFIYSLTLSNKLREEFIKDEYKNHLNIGGLYD